MILECPSCSAKYNVPDDAIGASGRDVRCKQCAHVWHVAGTAPEMPSFPEPADIAPARERPAKVAKPAKPPAPASAALTTTLAASFVLALIATLFTQKPAWFGFAPNNSVIITGIALASQKTEAGNEYAISGKLVNVSDQPVKTPAIRITLVDKEGTPLKQWMPQVPGVLAPQEPFAVSYGPLKTSFASGHRFVVDIGNSLELAMRSKP